MLQFIKKNKTNFIWVLTFGLMGLILKPLVNLSVSLSNKSVGYENFIVSITRCCLLYL